jgi:uncharacterized membrane protein (UPF0127 family)
MTRLDPRSRLFFIIACLVTTLSSLSVTAVSAQQRFPVSTLNIGVHLIRAEIATTTAQRSQGLMFREQMAENEGMAFRFSEAKPYCMWMKNTPLPLSVAFVDDDGKIVNIEDMQPQTLDKHCAKKPARYALEMNLGWFEKRHIKPGAVIDGLKPSEGK